MARTSRRRFLGTVGSVAAATTVEPGDRAHASRPATGRRRTRFSPKDGIRRLSENLFVLEDTCNVYLVRDGSRGILVDFGSGKILDHLPGLGVTHVDWVLHTHHHRDQCQGDFRAVERRIPVAVPAHERHLFADAENFWRNRRVFHLYYVRNDFNSMTENIPLTSLLHDYGTFRWG